LFSLLGEPKQTCIKFSYFLVGWLQLLNPVVVKPSIDNSEENSLDAVRTLGKVLSRGKSVEGVAFWLSLYTAWPGKLQQIVNKKCLCKLLFDGMLLVK